MLDWTYRKIRRFVIAVIGMTLLLVGVALLALPGPGILFIVASLAVLAIEFVWARRLLKRLKEAVQPGETEGEEPGDPRRGGRLRGALETIRRRLGGRRGRPPAASSGREDGRTAESR